VLVVEDEAAVRITTSRILRRHGYRVVEAFHGGEALRVWGAERAAGRPIHAVVTDLMMPEMGGVELIARLRAEAPELPVLAVSGYAPGCAEEVGAPDVAFLAKPFAMDALLAAVAALLRAAPPPDARGA
jgi:CheY-like chemotaxis protein